MKQLTSFIFFILLFAACTTSKKVQVIKNALSKNDTMQYQIVSNKSIIDSGALVRQIIEKIEHTKMDFVTMNARLKVDYETIKNADSYIANVSMKKDSAIFLTNKFFKSVFHNFMKY
jgi:hypothetical protein